MLTPQQLEDREVEGKPSRKYTGWSISLSQTKTGIVVLCGVSFRHFIFAAAVKGTLRFLQPGNHFSWGGTDYFLSRKPLGTLQQGPWRLILFVCLRKCVCARKRKSGNIYVLLGNISGYLSHYLLLRLHIHTHWSTTGNSQINLFASIISSQSCLWSWIQLKVEKTALSSLLVASLTSLLGWQTRFGLSHRQCMEVEFHIF